MPAYFPVTLHMPYYASLLYSDPPYARLYYITFQWPSICPIILDYFPLSLHMPDYIRVLSSDPPYTRLC